MILNWVFVLILTMPGPRLSSPPNAPIFAEKADCEEYAEHYMPGLTRRLRTEVLASYICAPVNVISI